MKHCRYNVWKSFNNNINVIIIEYNLYISEMCKLYGKDILYYIII